MKAMYVLSTILRRISDRVEDLENQRIDLTGYEYELLTNKINELERKAYNVAKYYTDQCYTEHWEYCSEAGKVEDMEYYFIEHIHKLL